MSDKFREHVTGQSFALTLSRRMIDMLCQLDQWGDSYGLINTARGLEDRGLAEWVSAEDDNAIMRRYRLTDAGHAVIPLLRLAGLYIDYPVIEPPADLPEPVVTIKGRTE